MSTGKIKALSKSKGCTINDVVLALISTSLKDYFVKHGDETGHVTLSVPFTFRSIPQNKWNYKFCNQFAAMQIRLDLEAKFDDAVKRAQKMARNQLKKFPGAMFLLLKLYVKCFTLKRISKLTMDYGEKHSLVLSNIPGLVKPIHLCGNQISRLYIIPTSMGTLASGFVLFSVMDKLQCNISTDELQIEDFDLFLEIFNQKIKDLGIEHEGKN